jgi:SET family sugar efflux transporter-like MFS transporter
LLAVSVLANSAMVPLMPYLLATRSGWPLWQVGLYSFAVTGTTILLNRRAGGLVDRGASPTLLCALGGVAQVGAGVVAVLALEHPALLVLVVPLLAAGGATVPVFYAMGRRAADRAGVDAARYNSVLRVATSTGWMVGPAASFAVLGRWNPDPALIGTSTVALLGVTGLVATHRHLCTEPKAVATSPSGDVEGEPDRTGPRAMRWATAVVLGLSFAHIVTTSSLPVLLVEHTGIPETGTGVVLGIKACSEIAAILLAPALQRRLGLRRTLIACAVVAMIAYGVYLVAHGWVPALAGAALEGAYYGAFAAVALTWVQSLAPDRVGHTTGAYMTGIYTGVLLGAPVSGAIATLWLPGITVASILAAAAVLLLLPRGTRPTLARPLLP